MNMDAVKAQERAGEWWTPISGQVVIFERGKEWDWASVCIYNGEKRISKQGRSYQWSVQTPCKSGKRGLIRSSEWDKWGGKQEVNLGGLSNKIIWWVQNKNKLNEGRRLCASPPHLYIQSPHFPFSWAKQTPHSGDSKPTFFMLSKKPDGKYFRLVDWMISVAMTHICLYKVKAALNKMDVNEYGCIPIKLYKNRKPLVCYIAALQWMLNAAAWEFPLPLPRKYSLGKEVQVGPNFEKRAASIPNKKMEHIFLSRVLRISSTQLYKFRASFFKGRFWYSTKVLTLQEPCH